MVIINPLLTWCSAGRFHVSISFSFMNLSHHPPRTPTGAPATTNTIRQRLNPKILHGGRRTVSLLSRQHSPRWSRRVTEVAAASNHGGALLHGNLTTVLNFTSFSTLWMTCCFTFRSPLLWTYMDLQWQGSQCPSYKRSFNNPFLRVPALQCSEHFDALIC